MTARHRQRGRDQRGERGQGLVMSEKHGRPDVRPGTGSTPHSHVSKQEVTQWGSTPSDQPPSLRTDQ